MRILEKIMKMHKLCFCFVCRTWSRLLKKHGKKNGVEVIAFNGKRWLNEKHVEEQLKHADLAAITLQYSSRDTKLQDIRDTKLWQLSAL